MAKKQKAWPASTVTLWPLEKIIPYEKNARTHPDDQIKLLSELMKQHGVDQPIVVDEAGVILKGHGRKMAAQLAGFVDFPVVQHMGLSAEEKIALRIADNQVALLSMWDADLIKGELATLNLADYPLEMLGFDAPALASWMNVTQGEVDEDLVPEPPKKPIVRLGDMWVLGRHRIACGDSTDVSVVQRLMDGVKRPVLMVTDPPYGVSFERGKFNGIKPKGAAFAAIANDDLRGAELQAFVAKVIKAAFDDRDGVFYLWAPSMLEGYSIARGIIDAGGKLQSQIVWKKTTFVLGRADYHWQHEVCWYGFKGKNHPWYGGRNKGSVWDIAKEQKMTLHPTTKPTECMQRPIENSSKPGDSVYEPFSGSGTTIIACEKTARNALAIELDPVYVETAILRWQQFTGEVATLDGVPFGEVARKRKKGEPRAKGPNSNRKPLRRPRKKPDSPVVETTAQ